MSNLNHIAAKPSVENESSLQLGLCVGGGMAAEGKADSCSPCVSYPTHDWRNMHSWALITTLTLLSRASPLVNGFNFSKNVYRRVLA